MNKIKTHKINKKDFMNNLPSQIFVKLYNVRIVISDLSTSVFHLSQMSNDITCYVPLKYCIYNNSKKTAIQKHLKHYKFFKKIGKKINFF
jgi:hypothetical protein